jgi:hypothetical protein
VAERLVTSQEGVSAMELHIYFSSFLLTDMLKALLGNCSVNTFQRAEMETVSQWTIVLARLLGSSQCTN